MLYIYVKAAHVAVVMVFTCGLLAQSLAVANLWMGSNHLHQAIRRWDHQVTTPAMLATWALGISLAMMGHHLTSGWLVAKIALVTAMSGLHGYQSGLLRRSLTDQATTSSFYNRLSPALVVITVCVITTLVIAKPI